MYTYYAVFICVYVWFVLVDRFAVRPSSGILTSPLKWCWPQRRTELQSCRCGRVWVWVWVGLSHAGVGVCVGVGVGRSKLCRCGRVCEHVYSAVCACGGVQVMQVFAYVCGALQALYFGMLVECYKHCMLVC